LITSNYYFINLQAITQILLGLLHPFLNRTFNKHQGLRIADQAVIPNQVGVESGGCRIS